MKNPRQHTDVTEDAIKQAEQALSVESLRPDATPRSLAVKTIQAFLSSLPSTGYHPAHATTLYRSATGYIPHILVYELERFLVRKQIDHRLQNAPPVKISKQDDYSPELCAITRKRIEEDIVRLRQAAALIQNTQPLLGDEIFALLRNQQK